MRIGLVGWATRTGLGSMHSDIWNLGLAQRWLVPRHPKLDIEESVCPKGATRCNRFGDTMTYRRFLDDIDTLLIIERPVIEKYDLIGEALRRKILTICIPQMEWLPNPKDTPWVRQVNMMWAPTPSAKAELIKIAETSRQHGIICNWDAAILGGRWGVNLERFPFVPRKSANMFLFSNGFGGYKSRKGIDVIVAAAKQVPEIGIIIRSQTPTIPDMPANCFVNSTNLINPAELYQTGDVFLAPSRFEGLGLQLYEAQACGLPVITTAGPPMNACMPWYQIPAVTTWETMHSTRYPAYEANPASLAMLLRQVSGMDIQAISRKTRDNMEQYFNLHETFAQLKAAVDGLRVQLVKPVPIPTPRSRPTPFLPPPLQRRMPFRNG